jgi:hypothetical protein
MPFRRRSDSHVEVTVLRGKSALAAYKPVPLRAEVMDAMRAQNRMNGGRQIWWIMVYPGEPPARFDGYLGGFFHAIGGWAVCNLDSGPGRIDPAQPLGSDYLARIMLKGMLHELGHGFQLPHVGPLARDNAGNTLMGPTHVNYRRVTRSPEPRVYLCEAEAAMLASHPAFRGTTLDPGLLPRVQAADLAYAADQRNGTITVRGRVRGTPNPVYALVADEADSRPGEYWTKTYAGKVAADGSFQVVVSEPSSSTGKLTTWFVCENGAQTGDGKARGRESGISKPYTYEGGRWLFR